jgi:hypothetical protein
MCPGTEPRTFDALHRCLEHPLRRAVLCTLTEEGEEVTTLDALVDRLDETMAGGEDRLRIELHHVHLPKLSTFDVLEFDYRSGDVRFHPESPVSRVFEQELLDC